MASPDAPEIDLIICDNDGCLLPEHNTMIDPADLAPIAEHNRRAARGEAPPLIVCTGRPQPFVEFLMRVIHCDRWPCVCEGGVYLYRLDDNQARLDPAITADDVAAIRACEHWVTRDRGWNLQAGKNAMVSIFVEDESEMDSRLDEVRSKVESEGWPFEVGRTITYINVTLRHVSKATAARRVLDELGVDGPRVLSIGDTAGDLPLREVSGHFACPANATDGVRRAADYVSERPMLDGVLDILERYV
ncbi:MAG: HAD family hydrolase [Phycisphaerales bacterium]